MAKTPKSWVLSIRIMRRFEREVESALQALAAKREHKTAAELNDVA